MTACPDARRFVLSAGSWLALLGGCLLLFASRYAALGWGEVWGTLVKTTSGGAEPRVAFGTMVLGITLMVVGYVLTLRSIDRYRPTLLIMLVTACVWSIPLLLMYSIPSADITSYAVYGRLEALYGANPYTVPPGTFPGDPYVRQFGDRNVVSVYGPTWQVIAWAVAWIGGPDASPLSFIAVYKLLGLVTLMGIGVLVWRIVGRIAPEHQAQGTWLFVANPLCLLQLVASGHNDGLMMLLILLGLLALLHQQPVLAIIGFGLAVLTKWVVLILAPAYLIYVYQRPVASARTTREIAAGAFLMLAIGTSFYGNHWAGLRTFESITSGLGATSFNNSLALWVDLMLDPDTQSAQTTRSTPTRDRLLAGEERPENRPLDAPRVFNQTERLIKWTFTGLFVLWAAVALRQVRDLPTMLNVWGWTLFAYVCLASVWFWPWYGVWVLAVAALLPRSHLARTALVLSVSVMLITVGRAAGSAIGVPITYFLLPAFLPPLIYAIYQTWAAKHTTTLGRS